jgi:hypothetical protein
MKRILLALAVLALLIPAGRQAEAGTDISVDFFYDNLSDGGNWVEVGDYGYCWQPSVAVSNTGWRPYSDGYWAYTDVGWTWVSYEDFGWATYHYGRWLRLRGRGWVWVPGREWGPAWVSWRTGGDYVGWAPLPPRRGGDIYVDFSPIDSQVDIDFDIGPAYYNFIDVRYIGEPVLRERIFAADQNVTYITKTVNVTNITYSNSTVFNHGPDINILSRYSARPIQRLSLQRDANADPLAAARSKSLVRVQGDKLVIAAPQQLQKPPKPISPKVVKEKVALAQAPVEHGWEPAGDAKAQAELKEKIKNEDPKAVPPPTVQASEKAETGATPPAVASPAATSAPSTSPAATAATREKDKRNEKVRPSTTPAIAATAAPNQKNKRYETVVPPTTPATTAVPSAAPKPPKVKAERPKKDATVASPPLDSAPPPSSSRVAPPTTPPEKPNRPGPDSVNPENAVEKPKRDAATDGAEKSFKKGPAPANPPENRSKDDGKKNKKDDAAPGPTP